MRNLFLAASAIALAIASPAYADANGNLKHLVDEVWAAALKEQPIYASALGVDTYASEVGDYTLAAQDRCKK